jgi:hypothetical protein
MVVDRLDEPESGGDQVKKLLPVVLTVKRENDPKHPGSLISYRTIVAADDTEICVRDLPLDWLQYVKTSVNNYYVARQTMDDLPDLQQYTLQTAITIPGEPITHRTTKMLREISKDKKVLFSKEIELPIKEKVWLTCVFCVTKGAEQFSLPDLCAGVVYDLTTMKILPKRKISSVFCLDGSKIIVTDGTPKTIVYVRYRE